MSNLINWEVFEENSSTREALWEVAEGKVNSYNSLISLLWPKECKQEICKIRKIRNFKQFRTMIRNWCTRNRYEYEVCKC